MQRRTVVPLIISCLIIICSAQEVSATFNPICIGEKLNPGEELRRNQAIGPSWNCKDGGYRFGLNAEGWLAYWTFDDAIGWWPGVRGDVLKMEEDGNLVLYDTKAKKEVVWESGCYTDSDGATFQNTGGMSMGEVVDANGKLVWEVDSNGQESVCYPQQDEWPEVKCRGNILGPQVRLLREEYICGHSGHHRFGLNSQGKLGLWHGDRLIWASSQLADDSGDYLLLQKSGKLVLYENGQDGDTKIKWNTKCKSEGAILEIKDGGVILEERDGDILWSIDNLGIESAECNSEPRNQAAADCTRISNYGTSCQVQMIDRLNANIVTIQVNDLGNNKFEVIDNVHGACRGGDSGEPWKVSVKVRNSGKGKVDIDAGVPELQCKDMVAEYPMQDDTQLIWLRDDTWPCNAFGESLIYFMVEEWFYFG